MVSGGVRVVPGWCLDGVLGCLGLYQYQINLQRIILRQILLFLPIPSNT